MQPLIYSAVSFQDRYVVISHINITDIVQAPL